ncbi:unnamed protein product [Phytophthora fragariaefolia]|uniref:Unnamed protein product n=1 Tax=Phytophthora fragariaefolia TaxID=1490495 RepID=A0A9W6X8N7_9STRA|nr:unnamed protein product [Phytophthora fragariaefolia]
MEQELRSTFLLANMTYRHRSNFLRYKQGKRSLQDYVMELHNLEAAMTGALLSEDVTVMVFMDGVRTDPVRTELFRRQPKTFNEAVHVAMLEDHCARSAQDHTPHVEAREGPTPMEVSLAESARPQRTPRASGRCFGCNQHGHFRRNCPTNPWKVSPSSATPKEQVPGTTLLCLSVAAARSNLVVVTASVKGYPESMTVLIDSGASFNFAMKGSVARNNALYASALEASKSNTNVSVRFATGSIVSTRKVTIPVSVKFDDFNSVEPFIVLDMDDRYDLILGMPWLAKHEPWIDWRSRTIGVSHNPLADRTLAGRVPSSSRDGFVHEHRVPRVDRQFAGSSEVLQLPTASSPRAREVEVGDGKDPQDPSTPQVGRQGSVAPPMQSVVAGTAPVEKGAGVVARANKSGRVGAPTTQGVVAGSARATEDAGAGARATTSGRAGAPTSKDIKGDKATSTPKAEAYRRDADSAAEDRIPQVLDVFTGEPKVGEALTPLPTVAELLELEELSYVGFLDSLKAEELAEVIILRSEGGAMEFNSSSVMDPEVLEDERSSRRQTRYGAAILKDPSDPYHPYLMEFLDVVSDDPPSILPPDRGVRHEIDLVPGTKYCTTRQWPLSKEQVDVIDAFIAAKHAAGMVRESKSPHWSPTFSVRKPNGKWRMVHAFNKLNAATISASTPIPQKDVLQNNMAGCTVFSALDMVDGYYQLLMRESDIPVTADLRKWLGLANYLHKYSANYADMARPLTNLFKKDAVWSWTSEAEQAFESIKSSLQSAPVLALPDEDRPFSVVCDASDFAIGCALLQVEAEGRERVVSFQSRQLKAAEKNYPVHDKELFAMEYAMVKFRVHLLGQKPFVIYTDHSSLRTATSSSHLSQRMARYLSFFAEYLNICISSSRCKTSIISDIVADEFGHSMRYKLETCSGAQGYEKYKHLFNMDQTSIYVDMNPKTTITFQGERDVDVVQGKIIVWKPSVTFCRVLLLDSLKVHKMSTVRAQLEDAMTDGEFVPPGATMLAQPMDVAVMADFKRQCRGLYAQQHCDDNHSATPKERRNLITSIVVKAWETTSDVTIRRGFMKAGLVPIGPRTRDGRFTVSKPPAPQLEAKTTK